MYAERTRERGSYTIELSVLILGLLLIVLFFFVLSNRAVTGLYFPAVEEETYEEAFQKKIQKLRHEKVLREER